MEGRRKLQSTSPHPQAMPAAPPRKPRGAPSAKFSGEFSFSVSDRAFPHTSGLCSACRVAWILGSLEEGGGGSLGAPWGPWLMRQRHRWFCSDVFCWAPLRHQLPLPSFQHFPSVRSGAAKANPECDSQLWTFEDTVMHDLTALAAANSEATRFAKDMLDALPPPLDFVRAGV